MHWFVVGLLLVANVVLLLWQLLVHEPAIAPRDPLPDVGELRLLSELEVPPQPALEQAGPDGEIPAGDILEEAQEVAAEDDAPEPAAIEAPLLAEAEPALAEEEIVIEQQTAPADDAPVSQAPLADTEAELPTEVAEALPEDSPPGPEESGTVFGAIEQALPEPDIPTADDAARVLASESEPASAQAPELAPQPEPAVDETVQQIAGGESALDPKAEPAPQELAFQESSPPGQAPQEPFLDEPIPDEPAPEPPAPVSIASACWQIGPLDSPAVARALAAALPPGMALVETRQITEPVPTGYYVLIPVQPDRPTALRLERKLKAAGIEDSWVFTSGPLRNAISLGLFTQERNATRRLALVESKGFQPELRTRYRDEDKTELLVSGPAGEVSMQALQQLGAGAPTEAPCPE